MKARLAVVPILFLLLAVTSARAVAQGIDEAAIIAASKEALLSMPEPPLGYAVSKHPMVAGDKLLGFQVQVMREGAVSKVLVKVELRDLSDRGLRVAASKGYINGLAAGLKDAGFKVTASKVPDVEKADFKTPLVADLTFANDDNATILVQQ